MMKSKVHNSAYKTLPMIPSLYLPFQYSMTLVPKEFHVQVHIHLFIPH